jgi:hypothetical protein
MNSARRPACRAGSRSSGPWALDDAHAFEQRVHAELAAYRVSGEHFRLEAADAITRIEVMLAGTSFTSVRGPGWAATAARLLPLALSVFPAGRRVLRWQRLLSALLH